jgi:hypothetical protein
MEKRHRMMPLLTWLLHIELWEHGEETPNDALVDLVVTYRAVGTWRKDRIMPLLTWLLHIELREHGEETHNDALVQNAFISANRVPLSSRVAVDVPGRPLSFLTCPLHLTNLRHFFPHWCEDATFRLHFLSAPGLLLLALCC